MITFSNGHELDFACASGAMAFNGLGWFWEQPFRWLGLLRPKEMTVVAKTVTRRPRKGNLSMLRPWRAVRLLRNQGAVNAIGLTNPGIRHWIAYDYPVAKEHGLSIAASIQVELPNAVDDASYMAKVLSTLDLAYIEVNISCPNTEQGNVAAREVLEAICESAKQPLVAKVSFDQSQDAKLMRMVDSFEKVEAIHAINTVPWSAIYPARTSPLKKYHGLDGGVSGTPIFDHTLKAVKSLSSLSTPVIAGGGIGTIQDVTKLYYAGADGFSIGTLFIRKPWGPNWIINQWRTGQWKTESPAVAHSVGCKEATAGARESRPSV